MMERMVLDTLEARRMAFVGSYVRNMLVIPSFHLQYQTNPNRKRKHTIPLPLPPPFPFPFPFPFPQTPPTTAKIPFNTTIPTEVPTKVCSPRISK